LRINLFTGQGATRVGVASVLPAGETTGHSHPVRRETRAVITVVDAQAARAALVARTLSCPQQGCAGVLRAWSRARPRRIRVAGGQSTVVRPDRGRCTVCQSTQVLLPSGCLPRRAYSVGVVAAVLVAAARGRRPAAVAAAVRVPQSTVRRWVRAVTRSAAVLSAQAIEVARVFGDAQRCWPRPARTLSGLSAALQALIGAACAWTAPSRAGRGPTGRVGPITGIDYLALLAQEHYTTMLARLRVVDPTDALGGQVTGWQLINVVTAGRLLNTPAS